MQSFNEIVMEFNTLIHHQKFLEAIDQFYHPDIISQDNDKKATVGTESLRHEVRQFIANVQIHKIELVSLVIENNLSVTNWYYSFTHKQYGSFDQHQFSIQRWNGNKIVQEHHMYATPDKAIV